MAGFVSDHQRAIMPAMPASAYKTYAWVRPLSSHWRQARCDEVDCPQYRNGWVTILAETDPAQAGQAAYVRQEVSKGWKYTETRIEGGLTEFRFPPGQQCFKASMHRLPTGRPAIWLVRDGDWRGNPRGTPGRIHTRPEDWIEDFSGHQDTLRTAMERG